jgi:hypothetical protein
MAETKKWAGGCLCGHDRFKTEIAHYDGKSL